MPDIQAFRGIRYDLGHVGSLGDVLCPAFDQCTAELQEQHYRLHPANAIRLVENRREPGDSDEAPLMRAGKFFRNWQRQGVLAQDAEAAIYVCHQHYRHGGEEFVRRGFLCRSRLDQLDVWSRSRSGPPEQRRAQLQQQVGANLSPVLGLYSDESNDVQSILEDAILEVAPREAQDQAGVVHRIWAITDLGIIGEAASRMGDKKLHIAAGFDTYQAARRDQGEAPHPEHPAQFLLTMCVSLSDPGLQLEPACLLSQGNPPRSSRDVVESFGDTWRFSPLAVHDPGTAWESIRASNDQGKMAFYCPGDRQWLLAEIQAAGRDQVSSESPNRSEVWQDLGVSMAQTLVFAGNGVAVAGLDGLLSAVESATENIDLAAICMPPSVEHLQLLALGGESPPRGALCPLPHDVAGLVFHPTT